VDIKWRIEKPLKTSQSFVQANHTCVETRAAFPGKTAIMPLRNTRWNNALDAIKEAVEKFTDLLADLVKLYNATPDQRGQNCKPVKPINTLPPCYILSCLSHPPYISSPHIKHEHHIVLTKENKILYNATN
jgi:hypothetical protein